MTPSLSLERLDELAAVVRARSDLRPLVGLVLGSGLGAIADAVEDAVVVPYTDMPGWPAPTAPGHSGRLLLGTIDGTPVCCLQGRFHMYEGHAASLVVEPVLLAHHLGARAIVLTNAAGGVDLGYGPGTLMVIRDHLNLTGRSPLIGLNDDRLGPRFPELTEAWSPDLRAMLGEAGQQEKVDLVEGVYAGLVGPAYETPAEVRMLRTLGADAVGMSTVLEAIAARWVGMLVCGVSLVTNAGAGVTGDSLSHEEVLAEADRSGPALGRVLRRFVRLYSEQEAGASA